jgi:hypothetical protein
VVNDDDDDDDDNDNDDDEAMTTTMMMIVLLHVGAQHRCFAHASRNETKQIIWQVVRVRQQSLAVDMTSLLLAVHVACA